MKIQPAVLKNLKRLCFSRMDDKEEAYRIKNANIVLPNIKMKELKFL